MDPKYFVKYMRKIRSTTDNALADVQANVSTLNASLVTPDDVQTENKNSIVKSIKMLVKNNSVNFEDEDFSNLDLSDINFTGANLTNANLTSANLTSSNLTNANVTGAVLTSANLTSSNLTNANISGATLTDIVLTDVIISNTVFTDNSVFDSNNYTVSRVIEKIGNDIDGSLGGDKSGIGVSMNGDGSIVAIGAPRYDDFSIGNDIGHVRIYKNISNTWTQIGNDIKGTSSDRSGHSVSLSNDGSIVAIGAVAHNNVGTLRVYKNISNVWTQVGNDMDGENTADTTGWSVSLNNNGTIVAVSSIYSDQNGNDAGHVRVYENQSDTWVQVGNDIIGEFENDWSGQSISLNDDGTIIAIGAPFNDGHSLSSGHARIYENQSGTWTQIGDDIDGQASGDECGWSVSLNGDGTIVAVGSRGNDNNGSNSGNVRVFQNQSNTWVQIGSDINGENNGDMSGTSVSISSDGLIVAIGSVFNDDSSNNAGQVRLYENISSVWTQIGTDIEGEGADDESGNNISLSKNGSHVAIGAYKNDGNGADSGHVRIYSLAKKATSL